jgi:hypothetical protein
LRAELATTGKEASDNLARLDEMKRLTKRSVESTSDKYVQSTFHCRNTSTHRTELQNFARNLTHSSLNPMSLLHLLHKLVPLSQTSMIYGLLLRIVLKVGANFFWVFLRSEFDAE